MSKSLVPDRESMTLEEVYQYDPKVVEAVRVYTDPTCPEFGNQAAAAERAGYTNPAIFRTDRARVVLAHFADVRMRETRVGLNLLSSYQEEAAMLILRQMVVLQEQGQMVNIPALLEPVLEEDGRPMVTEEGVIVHRDMDMVKQAVAHNRNVVSAAKAAMDAARTVLGYTHGTPGKTTDGGGGKRPLGDMDDEDLVKLAKAIDGMLAVKKQALDDGALVVEGEVVEDEEEPVVEVKREGGKPPLPF